ncbi:MAG: T9SS type A sorting domain-containing protein [Candidatus Tenebribacter davisii]|nr:T9SS type A sorting domain-containing protein [Candidatus Tenebribacter davisii]
MKKYLLVLFIVLVLSSLAFGQDDISFTKMGLRGSGGSSDYEGIIGETISVSFDYSYTDVDNPNHVYNNTGSGNLDDEIVVLWYSGSSWSSASYESFDDGISVSNFLSSGSSGTGNGSFDFILPSAPTGGNIITYYQIFFGLKAPDGFSPPFYGDLNTSGKDFSSFTAVNDAPTGYYTYMEFILDPSTEAPILDLPVSYSIIADSFTIQYDQPETALEGSVIITFTNTDDPITDINAPHRLEVASEVSGTNLTIPFKAADLDGTTYVTSLTSNDYLADGAEYTIMIEYQDLAENTVASDLHTNITYNAVIIQASGGDYNAGTSFGSPSTNNAFFWIHLQKSGTGLNPTVDKIEFDLTGEFGTSDIVNLKIWRSSDDNFDGTPTDVMLITETTNIDHFIPDFSPDEEITSTGAYYFLTVDVSATATGIDEIGASINTNGWITASTSIIGTFPITGSTHPLPVTLTSFTVNLSSQPVINWTTETETNNAYWNIYRAVSQNMGQAIQLNYGDVILGQGTVTEPTDYTYIDNYPVLENLNYYYWLECIDADGEADIIGPVSLFIPEGSGNTGTPAAPDDYGLKQNYPNPFNPDTRINFALNETSPVRLTIYNLKGQRIKTIYDGIAEADMVQSAYWDGTDASGKSVATGVYLYRLKTNKTEYSRRMLLMK